MHASIVAQENGTKLQFLERSSQLCTERLPGICRNGQLFRLPQPIDARFNDAAGSQESLRSESQAHTRWRSGGTHITRKKSHESANIAHEEGNTKNEIGGVRVLHKVSVNLEPKAKAMRIRNLVRGGKEAQTCRDSSLLPIGRRIQAEKRAHCNHCAGNILQRGLEPHFQEPGCLPTTTASSTSQSVF
jgi:hypothetical protein